MTELHRAPTILSPHSGSKWTCLRPRCFHCRRLSPPDVASRRQRAALRESKHQVSKQNCQWPAAAPTTYDHREKTIIIDKLNHRLRATVMDPGLSMKCWKCLKNAMVDMYLVIRAHDGEQIIWVFVWPKSIHYCKKWFSVHGQWPLTAWSDFWTQPSFWHSMIEALKFQDKISNSLLKVTHTSINWKHINWLKTTLPSVFYCYNI